MKNDDIEALLGRLTPRGVRSELRQQVLAAVASELKVELASRWLRRSALAVAASILAGIVMNIEASRMAERHLAQLYGPPAVSKQAMELAKAIEAVTDAQTAQSVYLRLAAPHSSGDGLAAYSAHCAMLRQQIEISFCASKEPFDETPQKDSQMDRDRSGRPAGDRSDCQRYLRLDRRCTA
jgi:hypothetical protein